ncbi:MAG TPA: sensor histidine kinase [Blastocatellia bacterium]|jgi:sensor histidine kinase YesM
MLWALVVGGWTLIGLTFTLNYYIFAGTYVAIFKQPPTLSEMLIWELPYWLLWAALSPIIFWITRRFSFDRGQRLRSAGAHMLGCLLLSVGHRAVYLLIGWLLHVAVYHRLSSLSEVYNFLFFFNLPTGFMSYATVLLVSYVIDYYRRYEEEELKISKLKTELAEAQLRMTQAQLQALKMQLQPHFLFNTLNSISALLEEDVEAADEMIARLGDFLRMTLENSGAEEVTLQEELEFLRCYLEIESVRFNDRLTVNMDIEPEALDARVPNLILQPIVENAIRHAVASRAGAGRIEIRARRESNKLSLSVRDDGPGLSLAASTGARAREGIGLANTRARLEQLYKGSHSFDMCDARGGGLQVTVEIPFEDASRAREKLEAITA